MAAMIEFFIELVAALIRFVIAVIPLFLEALWYLCSGAFLLVAYALSPGYRRKKAAAWASRPWKKIFDLSLSFSSLVILVAILIFFLQPSPAPADSAAITLKTPAADEDLRAIIAPKDTTNTFTLSVKQGGLSNLFNTRVGEDLVQSLRTNLLIRTNQ